MDNAGIVQKRNWSPSPPPVDPWKNMPRVSSIDLCEAIRRNSSTKSPTGNTQIHNPAAIAQRQRRATTAPKASPRPQSVMTVTAISDARIGLAVMWPFPPVSTGTAGTPTNEAESANTAAESSPIKIGTATAERMNTANGFGLRSTTSNIGAHLFPNLIVDVTTSMPGSDLRKTCSLA